jgi:hypothetical protein
MLRSLYRRVLRLHPPGFQGRFAEEMLSIFDRAASKPAAFNLLLDGFLSLVRQWTLRPEFWRDLAPLHEPQRAHDDIPSFHTIDSFRPRTTAMIHGLVLSTAVFCMTCFAIKYSWIRVLHVRIPEIQFEGQTSLQSNADRSAIPRKRPGHEAESEASTEDAAVRRSFNTPRQPTQGTPRAQNRAFQSYEMPPSESQESSQVAPGSKLPDPASAPRNAGSATTTAGVEGMKLDAAERQRVINAAVTNLREHYVDRDVAKKMADALLTHEMRGDDSVAMDGTAFAHLLTGQMRDVSHDMHLEMVYSQSVLPRQPSAETAESAARYRRAMEEENCMFEKVEILPGNIGYLKLNAFPDPSICRPTAAAAMAALNHADAIIFDLRDNRGGMPEMTSLIAAYLFDHPEYWYNPRENTTRQSWTASPLPGNRLADKPAYVLTSARTFSGAEQFSYDLKMLKRATLVGETTGGAAHAGVWYRIDDHFGMGIPETKAINPFATAGWAETGVEPDVKVDAAVALETAVKLAQSKLPTR